MLRRLWTPRLRLWSVLLLLYLVIVADPDLFHGRIFKELVHLLDVRIVVEGIEGWRGGRFGTDRPFDLVDSLYPLATHEHHFVTRLLAVHRVLEGALHLVRV